MLALFSFNPICGRVEDISTLNTKYHCEKTKCFSDIIIGKVTKFEGVLRPF